MLYFKFNNYREFTARKNDAEFVNNIQATKNSLKTFKRAEARAKQQERKALTHRANEILFAQPTEAIAAIRKAISENIVGYNRLELNPKEVTVAYVIVHNGVCCTLNKTTLDNTKWEFKPVTTMVQLLKSLEQKRNLVKLAQRAIESGKLPEHVNNPRKYIATLIAECNE